MVYTLVVHLVAKDDPSSIEKLKLKLREASQIYSNDKETINWYARPHQYIQLHHALMFVSAVAHIFVYRFVMQDIAEPRKFTVVERYAQESVSHYLSPSKGIHVDTPQ